MKLHLSGPMTGLEDFNRPEFNRVAEVLQAMGHDVFNPAVLAEGSRDAIRELQRLKASGLTHAVCAEAMSGTFGPGTLSRNMVVHRLRHPHGRGDGGRAGARPRFGARDPGEPRRLHEGTYCERGQAEMRPASGDGPNGLNRRLRREVIGMVALLRFRGRKTSPDTAPNALRS